MCQSVCQGVCQKVFARGYARRCVRQCVRERDKGYVSCVTLYRVGDRSGEAKDEALVMG